MSTKIPKPPLKTREETLEVLRKSALLYPLKTENEILLDKIDFEKSEIVAEKKKTCVFIEVLRVTRETWVLEPNGCFNYYKYHEKPKK